MDLTYEDLEDGVRRIRLAGRMDVEGTGQIDLKLTSLAAAGRAFVVLDLALVEFLSSIGLGVVVRTAKAVSAREGKLVLLGPQPAVARVLATTGIDRVLPVFEELEAARRSVRPAPAG